MARQPAEPGTRRPSLSLVEALQDGVAATREAGARVLDRLQTRLEVWRLRLDPSTKRWIEQAHQSIADGSFEESIRNQPTPAEIVEQVKQARQKA